jgi:uridine kinase
MIIIINGVARSGKTTLAKKLMESNSSKNFVLYEDYNTSSPKLSDNDSDIIITTQCITSIPPTFRNSKNSIIINQ